MGWSRKTTHIPTDWQEREITLYVGGVVLEAWVWLNGELIKYHLGHSTPFEVSLGENLRYGEVNEIIIAVANTRTDRLGCVIRGFKGFSAGIYRTVYIKVTGKARIKDCYIYPSYLRSDYIYSGSDNENKCVGTETEVIHPTQEENLEKNLEKKLQENPENQENQEENPIALANP